MLIQETHKDVATKANGKVGSMSEFIIDFFLGMADIYKGFSSFTPLSQIIQTRVLSSISCCESIAETPLGGSRGLCSLVRSIKVGYNTHPLSKICPARHHPPFIQHQVLDLNQCRHEASTIIATLPSLSAQSVASLLGNLHNSS